MKWLRFQTETVTDSMSHGEFRFLESFFVHFYKCDHFIQRLYPNQLTDMCHRLWPIVIFLRFLHYRGLTEHWQIEFEHPSQPSGQLLSQGQSKFSFGWHAQYLNVLTLKHSCTDNCYLLSTQTISSLKQADKHSESVGSQDEMHLSVSSTQISRQAVFRS